MEQLSDIIERLSIKEENNSVRKKPSFASCKEGQQNNIEQDLSEIIERLSQK